MQTLPVHYSYVLVVASVLLSILAAYAAFSIADHMRLAETLTRRRLWLLGGSAAMGTGVWSMHYLGMLAIRMPVEVVYHVPTVVSSMLLAMAASAITLIIVSLEEVHWNRLLTGGVMMGFGIGAMHYVGMFAMRSSARQHYSLGLVLLSVVVAVGAATIALWVGFSVRSSKTHSGLMRALGAIIMGVGIAAMHYTAMQAVCFVPGRTGYSQDSTVMVNSLGEMSVVVVAGFVLIAALGTAGLEKMRALRKAHQALAKSQGELLLAQNQLRAANEQLSELSVRDGLTGLHNRRHLDAMLEQEWRRATRDGSALALLMIDVDRFKLLNDAYGHLYGDVCLREVARVLMEHPHRSHDVAARYGGEEFALLLPATSASGAAKIAEEIRLAVNSLNLKHEAAPEGIVTVSIGVCCCLADVKEHSDVLLRAADAALYRAKQAGRNRVVAEGNLAVAAA